MNVAAPFFFGPVGAQLFGWYHAGQHVMRSCAVLICQPVGHEYMYSHRAFRNLATRLSALGFPVLRFDYIGTGNSGGDAHGPDQVDRWKQSIGIAMEELRTCSGCDTVAVVGLRLGATLAGSVLDGQDIDAFVYWDPCVTGGPYIREVRMLSATAEDLGGGPVVNEATGDIEALGFALTPAMVKDITALDLLKTGHQPPHRALLIDREGSAAHERLAQHLASCGTVVTRRPSTEHTTFLVTAIRSTLPQEALDTIVQWFDTTYPSDGASTGEAPYSAHLETKSIDVAAPLAHEEVVVINDRLFGVLTTPRYTSAQNGEGPTPTIVFFNTGGDHHIGPRRMYVQLARDLAIHGFSSFRFDLSGIGDSTAAPGIPENNPYPASASADLNAVITYLRTDREINQLVLVGMCSGGYHSVHLTHTHPEVVGMCAINPPLYWKGGDFAEVEAFEAKVLASAERAATSLFSRNMWTRAAHGEIAPHDVVRALARRLRAFFLPDRRSGKSVDIMDAGTLMAVLPSNVTTQFIFAGNDLGLIFLRNEGQAVLQNLQERPNFTLSVVEGAGHVFMPLSGLARLNTLITNWLLQSYGTSANQWTMDEESPVSVLKH